MEIKTKYKIGDKLYFYRHDLGIVYEEVKAIKILVINNDICIKYCFYFKHPNKDFNIRVNIIENDVFDTKINFKNINEYK